MNPVQAPEQAPPVCYRHAGRVSYVRCVRCDRPICGECQIPASVGFQCPECVKAGAKSMRPRLGAFGGSVANQPYVVQALLGINVVLFLLTGGLQLGLGSNSAYNMLFARLAQVSVPLSLPVTGSPTRYLAEGVSHGEYYRLMTAMFLHFGIFHIGLNMLVLYQAGPLVERILGHWRFVLVYLGGGFAGSVLAYDIGPTNAVSAGASGAVFAVIGALLVITKKSGQDASQLLRFIGLNAVLNLAIAFTSGGIGWQAHIGGLVGGALLTAIIVYAPAAQRLVVQLAGSMAVLVILVAAVALRTSQLGS